MEVITLSHNEQFEEGCIIPYGYEIWRDGVFRNAKKMSRDSRDLKPSIEFRAPTTRLQEGKLDKLLPHPIWLTKFARDLDTQEELVEIAWKVPENPETIRRWFSFADLKIRERLLKQVTRGLPVRTNTWKDTEDYLDALIEANRGRLSWSHVTKRCGWHTIKENGMEYHGFMSGAGWIGPSIRDGNDLAAAPQVEFDPRADLIAELQAPSKGNSETWKQKFLGLATKNDFAFFLCMSGFAPPILDLVNQRSFIIHHWGKSGSGKTALAQAAGSIWGAPDKTVFTFNATERAFTEVFQSRSDSLIIYDELQMSGHTNHARLIYELVGEKHRRRSTETGGIQAGGHAWTAVIRMTGEEPLIGKGNTDLGGQRNRVLEVKANVLTEQEAKEVYAWTDLHHGGAYLTFIQGLQLSLNAEHGSKREAFRMAMQQRVADLADQLRIEFPTLGQRATSFATVALAAKLAGANVFANTLNMIPTDAAEHCWNIANRAIRTVIDEMLRSENSESLESQLLGAIRDDINMRKPVWLDGTSIEDIQRLREGRINSIAGYLKYNAKNEIAMNPPVFDRIVRPIASPTHARQVLKDCGALITRVVSNGNAKITKYKTTRTISRFSISPKDYYVFDYAVVFGGLSEDKDEPQI